VLDAFSSGAKRLPNESEVLAAIAYIRRRQGKFEEALAGLKKALVLEPKGEARARQISATLQELGRYPEAIAYLDSSFSLLPDPRSAYVNKADTYLLGRGDAERSRNTLEQVPTQCQPWRSLNWVGIYERKYQSALDRLDRSPVNTAVYMTQAKGLIYRFMNDSVHSRASFASVRGFLETEMVKRPL
jgi:tetratricopeptide (TPR) repeat protein